MSTSAGQAAPRPSGSVSYSLLPNDNLGQHKTTIKRLYLDDGLPLREVMEVMEQEHGVKASAKVYKSRFKSWGWRKNLRIDDEVLPEVIQGRSKAPSREFQLVNGQVIDSERLDRYLRRQKSRSALVRQYLDQQKGQTHPSTGPRTITPPERFHVVEAVLFQIFYQVPAYMRARFADTLFKTDVVGALRLTLPNADTDRWALFVLGLKSMVQRRKYEEALKLMHQAPEEVRVFLGRQPNETISGLFMLLAQSTRYCPADESPEARQFLRLVKSLTKYAASLLFESAQTYRSIWLQLVGALIQAFSKVEDQDLTETVFRAWKVHSQTWDRSLPKAVSSELSIATCDSLGMSKYRTLPRFTPRVAAEVEELWKRTEAEYGPDHKQTMQALWGFAQYSETDDDSKGLVGEHSSRTRGLFEELRRRNPEGYVKIAMWRFFADEHKVKGEYEEAEKSMRNAVEAAGEMFSPQHPLVLSYVSTLVDWMVEWYGEKSLKALELANWEEELKDSVRASLKSPLQTPTASPGSSA